MMAGRLRRTALAVSVAAAVMVAVLTPHAAGSSSLSPAVDTASIQQFTVPATVITTPVERSIGFDVRVIPAISWPVPTEVSSPFGHRTCGADQPCSTMHAGVDLAPGTGILVRAAAAGTVTAVDRSGSTLLGVNITIAHDLDGEKLATVYGHLQEGSTTVDVGDNLTRGQAIATIGDTGRSYGVHLHFEVRPGGGAPVDPVTWMAVHGALPYPG